MVQDDQVRHLNWLCTNIQLWRLNRLCTSIFIHTYYHSAFRNCVFHCLCITNSGVSPQVNMLQLTEGALWKSMAAPHECAFRKSMPAWTFSWSMHFLLAPRISGAADQRGWQDQSLWDFHHIQWPLNMHILLRLASEDAYTSKGALRIRIRQPWHRVAIRIKLGFYGDVDGTSSDHSSAPTFEIFGQKFVSKNKIQSSVVWVLPFSTNAVDHRPNWFIASTAHLPWISSAVRQSYHSRTRNAMR